MLTIISHSACLGHDTGEHHPESRDRLDAINDHLLMSGLDYVVMHRDSAKATLEQLERVHARSYIDSLYRRVPETGVVALDDDTFMGASGLEAALYAAGAGPLGVDLIMAGRGCPVFCAVRPPGHHAERAAAQGFCLFNNIAVAAAHAMEAHGMSKVAIVDFDVHHGNGTESIFADDPRVLFCSVFQHPFYPYSGHESDTRNLVDVPLPLGTKGPEFRAALTEHWLPALDAFAPEFVFVSAGFDGHVADDMSGFQLVEADYFWVTAEIAKLAERHAGGRVLSMLEGGYEPGALARSVNAHINALLDPRSRDG
jgi:acetoin utilization deacetylase AcuC-like enzyme